MHLHRGSSLEYILQVGVDMSCESGKHLHQCRMDRMHICMSDDGQLCRRLIRGIRLPSEAQHDLEGGRGVLRQGSIGGAVQ